MTDTILRFDGADVNRTSTRPTFRSRRPACPAPLWWTSPMSETYRAMTREALALAARLTVQLRRAEAVIVALRTELRARRAA